MVIDQVSRLKASRRAHRAHVTRLQTKAQPLMESESPSVTERTTLQCASEDLECKKTILEDLDNKVAEKIDLTELEQDIFYAEELRSVIIENIQHIRKFLEVSLTSNNEKPVLVTDPSTSGVIPPAHAISPPLEPQSLPNVFVALDLGSNGSPPPNNLDGTNPVNTGSGHDDHPLNPASTVFVPAAVNSQTAAHPVVNRCRLPKLNLPTFSGNPLDWQTF